MQMALGAETTADAALNYSFVMVRAGEYCIYMQPSQVSEPIPVNLCDLAYPVYYVLACEQPSYSTRCNFCHWHNGTGW